MILAIDIGNTHTKLGSVDENEQVTMLCRIPTDRDDTEDGYAARISQIFAIKKVDPSLFEDIVISSVVPPVTQAMKGAIKSITGKSALVLGQNLKTDLDIKIPGGIIAPDLEATAVAARNNCKLPAVIINMGTATTITVVDQNGSYIGGAILPGVGTSLNALTDKTSLLPGIEIEAPSKIIADETVDSMKSGIVYGSAGAIDGILDRFESEFTIPFASIVATGGIGHLIEQYCRHDITLDDDLLLKGLYEIWGSNKAKH